MLSVIIPTYKSPEALDLCLKSAIKGQSNKNEIIVVIDGFYELNKLVLEKYKKDIKILNLEENVGIAKATNLGVYNTSYDKILIVNDDNVFPYFWDKHLEELDLDNKVYASNQIEPFKSIFPQFIIKDLGRDPKTFDLDNFWIYEHTISQYLIDSTGSTLPIFMNKMDFLKVGGWDDNYPNSWVSDCDFFFKCKLCSLQMLRTYNINFYHFVSLNIKNTPEALQKKLELEREDHEYFRYKWGNYMRRGKNNEIFV